MKPFKQIFCCLLFCCGVMQIQAQNHDLLNKTEQIDTIEIQKTGFGKSYYLNNECLTLKRLLEITAYNTLAHREIKQAQACNALSCVFGFIGGGCIGYPLGSFLGGGEPLWILAGLGVGFIAITIPIAIAGNRHLAKGVNIYNRGLQQASANAMSFHLDFAPTRIGIVVKF